MSEAFTSTADPLAAAKAKLATARAAYGVVFRTENDKGGAKFFKSQEIDPREIEDPTFKTLYTAYLDARDELIKVAVETKGADAGIRALNDEKRALWWERFSKTDKVVAGVVGAVALGAAIGPVRFIGGLFVSGFARFAASSVNLFGWNAEQSIQAARLGNRLQERWKIAEAQGLSFETFCTENQKLVRRYAKSLRWDRYAKMAYTSAFGVVTVGYTGIREEVLGDVVHSINDATGTRIGDVVVNGGHMIQHLVHTAQSALWGTVLALNSAWNEISPRPAMAGTLPADTVALSQEGHQYGDIKFPTEGLTFEDLLKLAPKLPGLIRWTEHAIEEYERTMDLHDDECIKQLAAMKQALHDLKAVQKALISGGKGGILQYIAKLNANTPGEHMPGIIHSLLEKDPVGRALLALQNDVTNVQRATDVMALLGDGNVYMTGAVQDIAKLFKHLGFDLLAADQFKMTPRTARMLLELYYDLSEDPRMRRQGFYVTSARSGVHSETGGHYSGDAFDMLPKGGITKEYIYRMYARVYENMLIAHHDPRIIKYFQDQIAACKKSGDQELQNYFEKRLRWAENPYAQQYYEFIYEPGTSGPPGIREEVVARLMKEYGIDPKEAESFMALKYGNAKHTTGEHFHIWPPSTERAWRSDPDAYMPPKDLKVQTAGD